MEISTICKRLADFKNNPQKFIEEVTKIIQREIRLLLNDGVKYYKIGDDAYYAVELFQNEELLADLNDNAIRSDKSPFDNVVYDSDIEASFTQRFENDENVKVYSNCQAGSKLTPQSVRTTQTGPSSSTTMAKKTVLCPCNKRHRD